MSGSDINLYGPNMSTCVQRVLMTLNELNLPYKHHQIDLMKGEHKNPEYIEKHQPFGKVPSLWDGPTHIFESRAIGQYLANAYGSASPSLYPQDARKKAVVDTWINCEVNYYNVIADIVFEGLFKKMMGYGEPSQEKLTELKNKFDQVMVVFEKHLGQSKYMAGDEFTLADIFYMPYTSYLLNTPGFEKYFETYPKFNAWWKTVSSRPAWKKTTGQ